LRRSDEVTTAWSTAHNREQDYRNGAGSHLSLGETDCAIKQNPSRLAPSVMTHKLGVFGVGSGEGLFAKSPSPENIAQFSLWQSGKPYHEAQVSLWFFFQKSLHLRN
jgi:hypothetical protein